MKRVKLAFPFTQLSGKLGAKQTLEYAENNNPAFEAPEGRQYARNYQPTLVVCQRVTTGKSFFQIKTKAATKINLSTKLRMALLGGTGACRAAILTNATYRAAVERVYAAAVQQGRTTAKTVEKYVYDIVYEALLAKSVMIQFFATDVPSQSFHNPWVYTTQQGGLALNVKPHIIAKFWEQLATNPITFKVEGLKGVAHAGDQFAAVIGSEYNILGLTNGIGTYATSVMYGNSYLAFEQDGTMYGALDSRAILENGASGKATNNYVLSPEYVEPWSD